MSFAVLVAFKYNEENSIYYKKCKDFDELIEALKKAIAKNTHFVSIRFPQMPQNSNGKLERVTVDLLKKVLGPNYKKIAVGFNDRGEIDVVYPLTYLGEDFGEINEKLRDLGFKWNKKLRKWVRGDKNAS